VIEERQSQFLGWKDFLASPKKDEVPPEENTGVQFVSMEP
jgi:hypothetical protein